MKEGLDLSNIDDKSKYLKSVLEELSKENDTIKQELILKKISAEFDIDINILKNNLKKQEKYSKIETLKKEPEPVVKLDKYRKATYAILYIMMNSYEKTKVYEKKLNYLPYKDARILANEIVYTYRYNDSLVLADFMTSIQDKEELFNLVRDIIRFIGDNEPDFEVFDDYIEVVRDYSKNQEIKRLKEEIIEEDNPVRKAELLEKIRLVKIGSEKGD